jgi:hypothetical protein
MITDALRSTGVLVTALLLLLLPSLPANAATLQLKSASSNFGSALLELDSEAVPVAMTRIPFRLHLFDADGQPLSGAKVVCNMDMPSMTMPENRPQVVPGDDAYLGEMIFTCTMGAWRISFDATHSDGRIQRVTFYVEQVRLR